MIPVWSAAVAGVGGAAVATLYWRRRLRTVERSLQTSAAWDEAVVPEVSEANTTAREASLLNRAASAADVPPEELPDRIDQLTEKIRDLQSRIESMREGWVGTYWQGLESDADAGPPRVVTVTLDGGTHDDARAFAIHALETEGEVVLAVGREDATVAVGVNESVTERFGVRADEVVRTVAGQAGGGGGGTESLATGGGEDTDRLVAAVSAYRSSVRERRDSGLETHGATGDGSDVD